MDDTTDLASPTDPSDTTPSTSARMPAWIPRAIVVFWLGLVVLWVGRGVLHALRNLFVVLLVSLFLSFAIEPAVNALTRRGWRRGAATGLMFVVLLVAVAVFVGAIGSLLYNQIRDFAKDAPDYVQDIEDWVNKRFDTDIEFDDLIDELQDPDFVENVAPSAVAFGATAVGVVFQVFTIALFTFYLVADGPRLRRTICSVLRPDRQRYVLRAWELAIDKTGAYLYSRLVLSVLSTCFHWIAFTIIGLPYPLPIALWVGVISQFIPTIGTYLAGALAVLVALLDNPGDALPTLIFVVVYQQVENYVFAPRVSAQTMKVHPAVAFAAVLAGASLLGAVGALLALPATAVLQAFISTFGERHEVVESELTRHPERPERERRRRRGRGGRERPATDAPGSGG